MIMNWSLIPALRAGERPRDPPWSPARPWSRRPGRPHAERSYASTPSRSAPQHARHGHRERSRAITSPLKVPPRAP